MYVKVNGSDYSAVRIFSNRGQVLQTGLQGQPFVCPCRKDEEHQMNKDDGLKKQSVSLTAFHKNPNECDKILVTMTDSKTSTRPVLRISFLLLDSMIPTQ